jgi:hypothetical protein
MYILWMIQPANSPPCLKVHAATPCLKVHAAT